MEGNGKKCIKVLELVREDDTEYQYAQEKIKALKLELGIQDDVKPKEEKKTSKPMLEYTGGYPAWTDSHKCLVKQHLTPEM